MSEQFLKTIKFDQNGLVPAIIQDAENGEVLMMAYMNDQAIKLTLETGKAHFYSRSRNKQWLKGESSGHTQEVREIYVDCDGDTILIKAKQNVAACHTGFRTCFYRRWCPESQQFVDQGEKVFNPDKVY